MEKKTVKGEVFSVEYHNKSLNFEFYNINYIKKVLGNQEKNLIWREINIPNIKRGVFKELKTYHENTDKHYYYFAYIKFFVFEGQEYGLVGGKTNYNNPDIDFSIDGSTMARSFLNNNKYEWSRKIIVVNYSEDKNIDYSEEDNKAEEDKQIKFLERYLQRQFNLLDS